MKRILESVPSGLPDPPYDDTVQAGSMPLDVDAARLLASDTYLMLPDEASAWWMATFTIAWHQCPCGSLPGNDEVCRVRLRCPTHVWERFKREILSGWTLHSDGRRYHRRLEEHVEKLIARRAGWKRKATKQRLNPNVSGDSLETLNSISGESPSSSSVSSSVSVSKKSPPVSPQIGGSRFIRPTVDEVRSYCQERGNAVNPEMFIDHYQANGWKQGQNKPIKDWKAAVRTWEHRDREKRPPPKPPEPEGYTLDGRPVWPWRQGCDEVQGSNRFGKLFVGSATPP